MLILLAAAYIVFLFFPNNALQIMAIDENLARAHRVPTCFYSYLHIALLALIVIFSVRTIGVLLAGAMLIVPAAAARSIARSAKAVFYYAIVFGTISGVSGLLISAQEWANTAAGATIVIVNCILFLICQLIRSLQKALIQ